MTTIAPGLARGHSSDRDLASVKPQRGKSRGVVRALEPLVEDNPDDDPTEYPAGEVMSRDPTESRVATKLEAVIARYQASRGIVCYTGSDNFLYWQKGNNKLSVSPDVYILLGISPEAHPKQFVGSKDEGCWKTWLHGVAPCLAVEVKAWKNPRKDELQSPQRHDALGTKELIVFDPFQIRRRGNRKRFVLYRRDTAGKLVPVIETNERRVYSEVLEAFIVAEADDEKSLLRVGLGPGGETLLPFESELVEMEAHRADEEARFRQEEARRADEQSRRADEQARRADEQSRRADEAIRRAAELETELARLRAGTGKHRKR